MHIANYVIDYLYIATANNFHEAFQMITTPII